MCQEHFNSQPHEEADADLLAGTISTNISTHSLTKRLTTIFLLFRLCSMYFNSQPHEEADLPECKVRLLAIISTHSLTKRLTATRWKNGSIFAISTHSLTKRLTRTDRYIWFAVKHFNSQPHEEADQQLIVGGLRIIISTHSLTKRLTSAKPAEVHGSTWHFNSQPHEEADETTSASGKATIVFQLTASRRGWPYTQPRIEMDWIFQLTASRRGWRADIL